MGYKKKDFISYMKKLSTYKLDLLSSGNISLRLSNNRIAIKPSGLGYGEVNIKNVSIVDLDGNHLGGEKPSSDLNVHLEIYRRKSEINCIIHTHSHYATVMSCLGKPLKVLTTLHADYFGKEIWCMPFTNHRTENIGAKAVESGEKVMLLERHSTLVFDENPEVAIKNSIVLEEIAKINYHVMLMNPRIDRMADRDIEF